MEFIFLLASSALNRAKRDKKVSYKKSHGAKEEIK